MGALGPDERAAVTDMSERATAADGVAPLSEAFVIGLHHSGRRGVRHVLGYAADGTVAAYGQVAPEDSAELLVDPPHRGRRVGRALAARLAELGAARVWAHGDLPAARTVAASLGWSRVRDLYLMTRPLTEADAGPVALPEGFVARAFVPGTDDEPWVETNAAAFAEHPEQGRLLLPDLQARMRLPWFDPAGFIIVEDTSRGPADPAIAAFHWTKVEATAHGADSGAALAGGRGATRGPSGEVYVLGVHPAYQGRGLAGPVTRLGLAHLAGLGLTQVHLYVDGDNAPARHTYARLGFVDASVDVMYAVDEGSD